MQWAGVENDWYIGSTAVLKYEQILSLLHPKLLMVETQVTCDNSDAYIANNWQGGNLSQ